MQYLIPVDLTAPSRCAVGLAACLGQATGAEALLLHVHQEVTSLADLAALDGIARPMHDAGVPARLRTARGAPATRICEEAVRRHSQLVIMGTRGETCQDSRADGRGSVARAVMRDCATPVIAVRPPSAWQDRWLWRGVGAKAVPGRLAFGGPATNFSPLARDIAVSLRRSLDRPLTELGWTNARSEAGTVPIDALQATDIVIVEHPGETGDDTALDATLASLSSVVVVVSAR